MNAAIALCHSPLESVAHTVELLIINHVKIEFINSQKTQFCN